MEGVAPEQPARTWNFNGSKYDTAEKCLTAVKDAQRTGKAGYWSLLHVELLDDEVKVSCKFCKGTGARFGVANIARFAADHYGGNFQTCVRVAGRGTTGKRTNSNTSDSVAASSSKRSKANDVFFGIPEAVSQQALDHLYMFFFTNPTVSLNLIEDEHLRKFH